MIRYLHNESKEGEGMTSLYIIFGLAMVVNAGVVYLTLGLALAEFKGIYLPLMKGDKCTKELKQKKALSVVCLRMETA
jgi:hypothetical protein